MPLGFYMDHHVPRSITQGLRFRGVDVLTAYEDGANELDDFDLLKRANELQRAFFTQDDDLLGTAANHLREGIPFYGVIYAHQLRISIGACIRELEILAKAGDPADVLNKVLFLPL